jgi:hypothetical protein
MLRLQELEKEKKSSILKDPISRAIITRVVSNKSIRVGELPIDRLPTITTLWRLYTLQKWGLLESEIAFKNDSCERVFTPTDLMSQMISMWNEI